MAKKVTLRHLSEKLQLSQTAVSKALRGQVGVSEKTRQLVLQTAKEMDYSLLSADRNPVNTGFDKIAIVIDKRDMNESHTMATSFWLDKALKAAALDSILIGVQADAESGKLFDEIAGSGCIGIMLFSRFSPHFVAELSRHNIPVIGVDTDLSLHNCDSVLVNDELGAFLAIEHIVKNGHTKIGFIGDRHLSSSFRVRHDGYIHSLEFWGIHYEAEYDIDIRFLDHTGNIDYSPLMERISDVRLPTVFFCANDAIAYVLNNTLNKRNIRVPEQLSIVGFDNLDSSQWQFPPLTTINYPREHIAQCAVDVLNWRLDHLQAPCRRMHVHPELVIRSSVAPPPKSS